MCYRPKVTKKRTLTPYFQFISNFEERLFVTGENYIQQKKKHLKNKKNIYLISIPTGSLPASLGFMGGFGTHTNITLFFPTLNNKDLLCKSELILWQVSFNDEFVY